jgi:hypothetical protein
MAPRIVLAALSIAFGIALVGVTSPLHSARCPIPMLKQAQTIRESKNETS